MDFLPILQSCLFPFYILCVSLVQPRPSGIWQGDDACALEIEVSPTARMIAVEGGPSYADLFTGGKDKAKKSEPWDDEDFTVPLALMTVGWDPAGDPTHHWNPSGRDTSCAIRLLNNQRVVVWFTSHTQPGSHPHPKVKCTHSKSPSIVPIGRITPVQSLGTEQEQPVVAVCGVVPVAAIVPVFPSIVHIPAL